MIRAVIFDYDGTIADTFSIMLRGANSVLKDMGYAPITDVEPMRDLTALQVLRKTKLPLWKFPEAHRRIRAVIQDDMQRAQLFEGMAEVVSVLGEEYVTAILSSNSADAIRHGINKYKIEVDAVYSDSSILGKHVVIKRALKELKLTAEEVIYVGDELRDIEACRKAGVKVISVSWGYNSKKALKAAKPDALVDTPAQLVKAVKKLVK